LYGGSVLTRWIVEQPVHVFGLARIAAQQPVLAEEPEITWLRHRLVRGRWHVIRVALALGNRLQVLRKLIFAEAQERQIEAHRLQVGELKREEFLVPLGDRRRLVVGQPIRLRLLGRQVLGDVDRDFLEAELPGGLPARVADDDDLVSVNNDRLTPTERAEGSGNGVDGRIVQSRVALVGFDPVDGPEFDVHGGSKSLWDSRRPTWC
jgi:hypothetical protein